MAGEARYRLGPLTLPAPGDPADGGRSEAVALFADRARRADARFALDGQAGPVVARLVARLDGMPLAIELAAARVEALGVAQLLDRIDDRFALLTGGDRLAADRQRSLAATVEWSYQLLEEDERRVFRAVSVFPAGFTLEGAEAVAGPGAGPGGAAAGGLLAADPAAGRAGWPVPVRDAGDAARLRGRAAGRDRGGRRGRRRAGRVRAAGGRAGRGRVADPVTVSWPRPAGSMPRTPPCGRCWPGRWRTIRPWRCGWPTRWAGGGSCAAGWPVSTGCSARPQAAPRRAASGGAIAQLWLGRAAQYSADLAAALGHFTAVRDAVADRPPSPVLAAALTGRAAVLRLMGRTAEAVGDARRALALAREIGDPVRGGAGPGRPQLSTPIMPATTTRRSGWPGRPGRSRPGSPARSPGRAALLLTIVLTDAGDLAEAERVGAAGLARARDAGDLWNQAVLLPRIADLDLRAGRTGDAAAHLREGLHLAARTGSWFDLLTGLSQCGNLCAATGRAAEALTLWAACAAVDQHQGPIYPPWFLALWEEQLRQARQALGPGRAREAEDRGAAMNITTAAEYALMLADPGPPQPAPPGPSTLSARERELVILVAQGRTNAQIAAELYISVRTVGSHLDRIRDKTGCRRRADLTRLALATGLV